jgi:formylglycine-generating enzyme required for sulfatase activity
MARLPAGSYRPLHVARAGETRRVSAFSLDRHAVTRGDFLAFVRRYPQWRRDRVPSALIEPSYLADWPSALDAGSAGELARPVTGVSWFAADAYCAAQGKRLPTLDEWEYAATASETRREGTADRAHRSRLLALYAARPSTRFPAASSGAANAYGVRGLHGSVWEWTHDSGPAAAPHHDHAAHARSGSSAPGGCASAALGAADPSDYPAFLRSAVRAGLTPRTTLGTLGFRCAA